MDRQFAFALILLILGLGLTQIRQDGDPFLAGLGVGTMAMASVWIVVRIVKDVGRQGRAR